MRKAFLRIIRGLNLQSFSWKKYAPVYISSSGNQMTLQIEVTTGSEQVSNATTVLVPHSVTSDADVVTTATGMNCSKY